MATITLGAESFEQTLSEHEIVLVFSQPGALPAAALDQVIDATLKRA